MGFHYIPVLESSDKSGRIDQFFMVERFFWILTPHFHKGIEQHSQ